MLEFLAIVLCGAFDRLRGAGKNAIPQWMTRLPWIIPYGLCLAFLLHAQTWWQYAIFIGCWWIGNRMGWTKVIQAVMQDSHEEIKLYVGPVGLPLLPPVIALYVRGVIWAAPALLVAYWVPAVFLFVPLAGVTMLIPALMWPETRWGSMEAIRGVLMGLAAFAAGMLI